jgi:hypothetical protein
MENVITIEELDPQEPIMRYLIDLPGVFLPHSGATLFHHLLGTYRILRSWGCEESLCIAGLFHSVYGTPAYRGGVLPKNRRFELINVIGVAAEALVHRFSDINWSFVFERGPQALKSLPRPLLILSAANLVEQRSRLAHATNYDPSAVESLDRFAILISYLPPPAARCLALELQYRETDA